MMRFTYKEWSDTIDRLACELLSSLKRGDRALLVYPPSIDFMIAFYACIRAGVIAVPVYPPNPTKLSKDIAQFVSIQGTSGASVALTSTSYNWAKKAGGLRNMFSKSKTMRWPELKWIVTDKTSYDKLEDKSLGMDDIQGDDVAFLQFTSGSTSAPKGVVVRHDNLAHNLTLISDALVGNDALGTPVVVSWLPQYHDMGLIGSWMGAMYTGGCGVYLSPISYMQDPVLWLRLMSRYKCTHTQAPNFSLRLTLRRYLAALRKGKAPKDLDLSSLKHFFNAAEPVSASDIDEFVETFSKRAGLNASAMVPGYGLAEHVVYVCDGGKQRLVVNVRELETNQRILVVNDDDDEKVGRVLVGCGVPGKDVNLLIVKEVKDGVFTSLQEDQVGEIWLRSGSKTRGYWNMPEKIRKEMFMARLEGQDDDEEGYFKTGDLGFIHGKELFICGRLKDMIIVRGRNYYPQDLERCAEEQDSRIRQGCVAAFSFSSSSSADEEVALVVEIRDGAKLSKSDLSEIATRIHSGIIKEHGVSMHDVVLLHPRTISKTSSGKIQRQKNKLRYLNASDSLPPLEVLFRLSSSTSTTTTERPSTKVEESKVLEISEDLKRVVLRLKNEIADLLMDTDADQEIKPSSLDGNTSLLRLGLASMQIEQLRGVLLEEYKLDVDIQHFFQDSTTIHAVAKWTRDGAPEPIDIEDENGVDNNNIHQKEETTNGGSSMQISGPPATPVGGKNGCCVVM